MDFRNTKEYGKKWVLTAAAVIAAGSCLAGCAKKNDSPLDPASPVSLTVWHYYHGAQQDAFDSLVAEFNATVGKEKGIYVQGINQGSVTDLEKLVKESIDHKVGSMAMPDIFSSYADTAYEIEQTGALANLSDYLSEEEQAAYVDSYIEEGRIANDGSLRIFPVAKSTEIMMLNKTGWDEFARATGASLDELSTMEGVVKVAEKYYNWTDSLTPDIPDDGKSFYGRDAMANYFCIGMRQLGHEIFEVDNGSVTLDTDRDALKRLWDCYYVPMVKGYFGAYGSYRSDDVKTGDILAYTGSSTSSMYFPDEVETDGEREAIECAVMMPPVFEGGEDVIVQQGAGMVVSKSDRQHEYASVEFLKWFTEAENNLVFCSGSGYLPVLKSANSREVLDQTIRDKGLALSDKSYDSLAMLFDEMDHVTLYTNMRFRNGTSARQVLEDHLFEKAQADRENVKKQLSEGMTLEEACAPYLTDDAFEQWYQDFCAALSDAIK